MKYPKLPIKKGEEIWFLWDGSIRSDIVQSINVEFRIEDTTIYIIKGSFFTEGSKLFPLCKWQCGFKPFFKSREELIKTTYYKNNFR